MPPETPSASGAQSPRRPPLALVLDQGGHSTRAAAVDPSGTIAAAVRVPVATTRDERGRSTQDAEAILHSTLEAASELLQRLGGDAGRVRNAALAAQRSSVVCWRRDTGAPLSPVLGWQDRRGEAFVEPLAAQAEEIRRRTGLMLTPNYGASKLRWCQEELPEVREAQRAGHLACGPLTAYLLHRLLAERPFVVDATNAARTSLVELDGDDWSPWLLQHFGVDAQALPRMVPSAYPFGHLRFGRRPIPLEVCVGDQAAACFAFGELPAGSALINAGTGAFVLRRTGTIPVAPEDLLATLIWHDGERRQYAAEGTVHGASSALDWAAQELGLRPEEAASAADNALAATSAPSLFVNTVDGLGSPYWRAGPEPGFANGGDVNACLAGVLESIGFLLRVNLERIDAAGAPAEPLVLTGGLARLEHWPRRLATITGRKVLVPPDFEATLAGLARLAHGTYAHHAATDGWTEHDSVEDEALEHRFRRWRELLDVTGD